MQTSQTLVSLFVFSATLGLGVWAGTCTRRPWPAFFIAWVVTPLAGALLALIVACCLPTMSNLGWLLLIEMPIAGTGIGLVAGIVAALVVRQREGQRLRNKS